MISPNGATAVGVLLQEVPAESRTTVKVVKVIFYGTGLVSCTEH